MSRWYPTDKQGTALGIFGAGNVGAAVTKFLAPFVLVAYGWQAVAQVWALAIGLMGIAFWFFYQGRSGRRGTAREDEKPSSAWLELEPLKNVQVWRFALYYFFVFGAFVALSLWLPHYLIGVYGLDITTAGMIGAAYSRCRPACSAPMAASLRPLRRAARDVLDLPRLGRLHLHAVLSADRLRRAGSQRPDRLPSGDGPACLHRDRVRARLLHGLGKAAVYKHIPVYYPNHVGAVGGLVGMIGGLGGFVLPIAFGVLTT